MEFTKENVQILIKEDLSLRQMGERLGCSAATVRKFIKNERIQWASKNNMHFKPALDKEVFSKENLEKMVAKNMTVEEMAHELLCGITTVRRVLKAHGIERKKNTRRKNLSDKMLSKIQKLINLKTTRRDICDRLGMSDGLFKRLVEEGQLVPLQKTKKNKPQKQISGQSSDFDFDERLIHKAHLAAMHKERMKNVKRLMGPL